MSTNQVQKSPGKLSDPTPIKFSIPKSKRVEELLRRGVPEELVYKTTLLGSIKRTAQKEMGFSSSMMRDLIGQFVIITAGGTFMGAAMMAAETQEQGYDYKLIAEGAGIGAASGALAGCFVPAILVATVACFVLSEASDMRRFNRNQIEYYHSENKDVK